MKPVRSSPSRLPALRPLAACLAAALALGTSAATGGGVAPFPFMAFGPQQALQDPFNVPSSPTATTTVANCNDSGAGSLRDAILSAASGALIDLTQLTCSTITLTSGAITTNLSGLQLQGPGSDLLAIDGGGTDRILNEIASSGGIQLSGLTVRNGQTSSNGGCILSTTSVQLDDVIVSDCHATGHGGGLYINAPTSTSKITNSRIVGNSVVSGTTGTGTGGGAYINGPLMITSSTVRSNTADGSGGGLLMQSGLTMQSSTVSGNHAEYGGGLYLMPGSGGTAYIGNSTISGNHANSNGGGVFAKYPLEINDSTIAFNVAQQTGGGLFLKQNASLQSTIIARNTAGTGTGDIDGNGTNLSLSGTNNLIMTSTLTPPPGTLASDPMLSPLADNGGPTFTHALMSGSPAINAGYSSQFYDQRTHGMTRVVGPSADIGAYEVQSGGSTHTIANCADSGSGSLRDTVDHAQSGDTIDLRHLSCSLITLTTGALQVPFGNLDFVGPGAHALTIDGNNQDRVINHTGRGTLQISDLTLAHGFYSLDANVSAVGGCLRSLSTAHLSGVTLASCKASGSYGALGGGVYAKTLSMTRGTVTGNAIVGGRCSVGGIYVQDDLDLRDSLITNNLIMSACQLSSGGGVTVPTPGSAYVGGSTIAMNQAKDAGGLNLDGTAQIVNSTISGNTALRLAGVAVGARSLVANSTIAFNTSTSASPSGLEGFQQTFLQSSIVFGNTANGSPYDLGINAGGAFVGANNLVGSSQVPTPPGTLHGDPLLGPLQDNGGLTPTHALPSNSPAIDTGNNAAGLAFDQRGEGFVRVAGTADIGAFERQPANDVIFRNGFDPQP